MMLMLAVAVEEGDELEEVEPAHRVRNEVDVVELEVLADEGEALVDSGEERALRGSEAADACKVRISAEHVQCDWKGYGGDDEAVHS
jgi:hypothetical protein